MNLLPESLDFTEQSILICILRGCLSFTHGLISLVTDIKAQALQLIRSRGRGMNPSAVWKILTTEYGIQISKETVRKLMIAEKAWLSRPSSKSDSD